MNNQHHNYYIEPDFSLRNIITLLLKRAEMCFHLFQLLGNTSLFMLCIKSASLHFPAVTENRAGRQGECGWFPESSRFHTLLQHPPPLLSRTCIFPSPGKAGNRDARTLFCKARGEADPLLLDHLILQKVLNSYALYIQIFE